jgi:hypothetical protein
MKSHFAISSRLALKEICPVQPAHRTSFETCICWNVEQVHPYEKTLAGRPILRSTAVYSVQ